MELKDLRSMLCADITCRINEMNYPIDVEDVEIRNQVAKELCREGINLGILTVDDWTRLEQNRQNQEANQQESQLRT